MGRVWAGQEKVGGERGLPPDRSSAVPRVCSPRSRPVSGAPVPHPSPLGSHSRGCDGGTAAGASPGVGIIGPRGEGVGWRCGQVDFRQGAGWRGVVLAKVRVKGSVTAGDGLAVDGHASTSLEIIKQVCSRSLGLEDWEATVLVCWER